MLILTKRQLSVGAAGVAWLRREVTRYVWR